MKKNKLSLGCSGCSQPFLCFTLKLVMTQCELGIIVLYYKTPKVLNAKCIICWHFVSQNCLLSLSIVKSKMVMQFQ